MQPNVPSARDHQIDFDNVYRQESRKVFATLVRLLGDFDLAEEALHDAFASALEQWPLEGLPANPSAWLVSAGRFKAIDRMRRRVRFNDLQPEITERLESVKASNKHFASQDIKDDQLRLIFTCCHPAIDPKVQVPLTLREVCGMTTEEIASAFLTTAPTMAQRIVRGKTKIRDAGIPFVIPTAEELPERLDSVLAVIYLVFNEGYAASRNDTFIRVDLTQEAIRLARLLVELLPDAEAIGLLALMLLHESRRHSRLSVDGDIILLEDQDRSKWNQDLIAEGRTLVRRAIESRRFGTYTLQAAISATHAGAKTADETNWPEIVALYNLLFQAQPSPIIELNRAVAIAMKDGPKEGLKHIDAMVARGELIDYHLLHAARADLLRRLERQQEASNAYRLALSLAKQPAERRFLEMRINQLPNR